MPAEAWIVFAVLSAILAAGTPLIGEYTKVRSLHLLFWMRLLASIMLLPVLFLVAAPEDPVFYLAVLATALIFAFTDLVYVGVSAKSGAGVVTRTESLSAWTTFLLWTIITPSLLLDYLADPVRGLGIFASISGSAYFALKLRKCPVSWEAFRIFIPVIILNSFGIVFAKIAMDHAPFHSGVFYYALVQGWTVSAIYMLMLRVKILPFMKDLEISSELFGRKTLAAGTALALFWCASVIVKYYGITLVENPAYVTVIGLTTPFWVLLVYRVLKRREEADIRPGIGLVACTALLVFFTRF